MYEAEALAHDWYQDKKYGSLDEAVATLVIFLVIHDYSDDQIVVELMERIQRPGVPENYKEALQAFYNELMKRMHTEVNA